MRWQTYYLEDEITFWDSTQVQQTSTNLIEELSRMITLFFIDMAIPNHDLTEELAGAVGMRQECNCSKSKILKEFKFLSIN